MRPELTNATLCSQIQKNSFVASIVNEQFRANFTNSQNYLLRVACGPRKPTMLGTLTKGIQICRV
jgi:hypothetical protein